MSNPLDSAMGDAERQMMIENMRDTLPAMVELMAAKAKLNAEYYKKLIAEGIPEGVATYIIINHDPFKSSGQAPDETGGPDV